MDCLENARGAKCCALIGYWMAVHRKENRWFRRLDWEAVSMLIFQGSVGKADHRAQLK